MDYDKTLLDAMLADMETAPEVYRPTNFWREGTAELLRDLEKSGIENFRSHPSCLKYFVPTYAFPGFHDTRDYSIVKKSLEAYNLAQTKYGMMVDELVSGTTDAKHDYRVYLASNVDKAPFVDKASESEVGNPVERFEFEGRHFSRSMLNYLLGLSFLKKTIDTTSIKTVLEIGGGFGTLGEILLGDQRNDVFYVDVDIPPTCFFSTYYLKQVFGDEKIGGYGETKGTESFVLDDLKKQYKGLVLTPWQLPKLKGEVDLFVNFISFQEMEPEIVQNYLSQINRLSTKYLLLRNLREGKNVRTESNPVGVITPIKGGDYDRFLPNYKLIDVNVFPFGLKNVDNFHSELRLYERCES